MWPVSDQLSLPQVADKTDRLDGFSESHIVGQEPIHVILIEGSHPLECIELMRFKSAIVEHLSRLAHVVQPV